MSVLKDRINADLKSAMLSRDEVKTQTLQGLKAAILNEEVAKRVRETGLDEAAIEQVIAREAKKRDEAADLFEKGGNMPSAEKERLEKQLLSVYLPEQMSEDEVREIVQEVLAEIQPEGMKDMGRVIGAVQRQPQKQRGQRRAGQQQAAQVRPGPGRSAALADPAPGQAGGQQGKRQVAGEHPAPRTVVDDQPAKGR